MVSLADRRRGAEHLESACAVSERRACQVVGIARSTKRRPSGRIDEVTLVARIHALSEQYPRFGYRKIFERLKGSGWRVGRERVRLLRRREGLRVPQKAPKITAAVDDAGTVRLSWERSARTIGLEAEVHRGTGGEFEPTENTLLEETLLAHYLDKGAPAGEQHYALVLRSREGRSNPSFITVNVPSGKNQASTRR